MVVVFLFRLGFVNVLLLYNTFRVLKPAFSGLPSSRQGSDLEAQSQGGSKGSVTFSGEKSFASWDEKTISAPSLAKTSNQYRISVSSATASVYSQGSGARKPLVNPISTDMNVAAASLGCPVTPIDELDRMVVHARTGSSSTQSSSSTLRPPPAALDTSASQQKLGLSPPPRSGRSPVRRHPSHQAIASQYTRSGPSKKLMKKVSLSAVAVPPPRTPTSPRSFSSPRGFASPGSRSFSSPSDYSGAESEIPLSPYLEAYVSLPLPPVPESTK